MGNLSCFKTLHSDISENGRVEPPEFHKRYENMGKICQNQVFQNSGNQNLVAIWGEFIQEKHVKAGFGGSCL
jgi:hypothetical protein